MLNKLRACEEDCILLIAHNPGCGMLAEMLLNNPPTHPAFYSYPTGATLIADFEITSWREVRIGTGITTGFVVPRDLIE